MSTFIFCNLWIPAVKATSVPGQTALTAEAYPYFCSFKPQRVFLLPPERDASPLQVTAGVTSPIPIYMPLALVRIK